MLKPTVCCTRSKKMAGPGCLTDVFASNQDTRGSKLASFSVVILPYFGQIYAG